MLSGAAMAASAAWISVPKREADSLSIRTVAAEEAASPESFRSTAKRSFIHTGSRWLRVSATSGSAPEPWRKRRTQESASTSRRTLVRIILDNSGRSAARAASEANWEMAEYFRDWTLMD